MSSKIPIDLLVCTSASMRCAPSSLLQYQMVKNTMS